MDIPLFFAGTKIDAEVLYKGSLYAPTASVNNTSEITFEILNGGLTADNFGGNDHTLQAHQVTLGAFAQGYYFGFNRQDFHYAEQFNLKKETIGGNERNMQRIVHASLTANVLIPWQTKCLQFGYQALFAHDATRYDASITGGTSVTANEFYDLEVQVGNSMDPNASTSSIFNHMGLHHRLPHNRLASETNGTLKDGSTEYSPVALEDSFRYVSKTGMISGVNAPSKGYLQVRVTVGCYYLEHDPRKSKLKTPSGSIWIMALR